MTCRQPNPSPRFPSPPMRILAPLLLLSSLPLLPASLAAQGVVAIKAGRVVTMAGADLTDVTVLVENGRITKLGADVEVPWNAQVIDATTKVVMPTYVLAHSSGGMRGSNENLANVPYLTVQDAVDPSSRFFDEALRNGIAAIHVIPGNRTLIGGQGMVCKPYGQTVEDLAIRARGGLKISLHADRGGAVAQVRKLRRAFDDVREAVADLERQRKEFEAEKAASGDTKKEFEGKLDLTKQPTADLLARKNTAFFYVPDAAMVPEALRIAKDYGFDAVYVLGERVHRAVARLSGLDHPVVLTGDLEFWEKDEVTGKQTKICPAAELYRRGVPFALDVSTGQSGAERYPWWQMATLMRNGVDRATALQSLTTIPAKILGLDAELGSLEVGKRASLQILTGDPLAATTWVDAVLVDGELVYERSKDPRLQHLFGVSQETDK